MSWLSRSDKEMEEQIEVALWEPWPRPASGGRMVEVYLAGFQTMEAREDGHQQHLAPHEQECGHPHLPGRCSAAPGCGKGEGAEAAQRHSSGYINLQTSVWDLAFEAFEAIAEAAFSSFIILLQEACTAAPGVAAWSYITVRHFFFCRAGRHRSVLMAYLFSHWLASLGVPTRLSHMIGPQYDVGCGCSGCQATEYDKHKRMMAMGKAFDFWNGILTRELSSRLPVDMWESILNPCNREPEPPQGETVDEAFDRMRAESARRTPLQHDGGAA